MKMIRGVLCAGGLATRLGEATRVINKHLLTVGDRPMIYYPLEMLQLAGIKEVCLVTGPDHAGQFIDLLQDGNIGTREKNEPMFHIDLTYRVQAKPGGIAQAILMAENFANHEPILVALGDNIVQFSIAQYIKDCQKSPEHARIFLAQVEHPEHYGVAVFTEDRKEITEIVEKPTPPKYKNPPSNWAVTGIYYYPFNVFEIIKTLKPSNRGELEVTDINNWYLKHDRLAFEYLTGWWEDAGESPEALAEASKLVLRTGANN
jgi:glucose-1-phosphate thymidylyltransferase